MKVATDAVERVLVTGDTLSVCFWKVLLHVLYHRYVTYLCVPINGGEVLSLLAAVSSVILIRVRNIQAIWMLLRSSFQSQVLTRRHKRL